LEFGLKHDLVEKLDSIAGSVTGTKRPKSLLLQANENPPLGWLIKREYSDAARHVIFPRNAKSVAAYEESGDYRWFAQEMVPLLRQWGEIRIIFLNKIPLYAVLTTPSKNGSWTWDLYEHPNDLATLR
jgi:hypothetical protein